MTFAAGLAVIDAHMLAAGTALTRPIRLILPGEPSTPPGNCGAYWYEGDGPPVHFPARTLTDEMVGERVTLRWYWQVSSRDKVAMGNLEADLRAVKVDLKSRLSGDSTLGGNCVDLDVGDADAAWLNLDGGLWRTLTIPLVLDYVDIQTIAP